MHFGERNLSGCGDGFDGDLVLFHLFIVNIIIQSNNMYVVDN